MPVILHATPNATYMRHRTKRRPTCPVPKSRLAERLAEIQATVPRGVYAHSRRLAGCVDPACFAVQATRGASATRMSVCILECSNRVGQPKGMQVEGERIPKRFQRSQRSTFVK